MTAVIWKEFRENLKWAVLWLLGLAGAMACALLVHDPNYWQGNQSLCGSGFLLVTTIGAALGGALLGLLQVVPELRREQWAFLVHRPATRTALFMGKALAGLSLYLVATGIPLLGAAVWAATPGNIAAPFDWRMALPGVADILTGIVFYFAGILTGVRPARWYGSRALGIFAAIPCALIVHGVPEFWHALLVFAAFGTVLAVAAWGAFLTAGEYRPQPRSAKLTLGLTLFVGIATVGSIAAGFIAMISIDPMRSSSYYIIDKEGMILLVTQDYGAITSVTDLDGNPVEKYRDIKARNQVYLDTLSSTSVLRDWTGYGTGYRDGERFFLRFGQPSDVAWYYYSPAGRIQGYSLKARRLIGSIGPQGFASVDRATTDRFEGELRNFPFSLDTLLVLPDAVYQLDRAGRTVSKIYTAAAEDEVRGAGQLWHGYATPSTPAPIAVATTTRIHLIHENAAELFSAPFHYDLQRYSSVNLAMLPDGAKFFVWYAPSPRLPVIEQRKLPSFVVELSADGVELARHELPPIAVPGGQLGGLSLAWAALFPCLLAVVLCAYGLWASWVSDANGAFSFADWFQATFPAPVWFLVTFALILVASASVCALVSLAIARRCAFQKTNRRVWAILIFLIGPAGLLTLIALRDWPAREVCPACGARRVVDRDRCEHCAAEFAPPQQDGTEVFDDGVPVDAPP